MGADSPVENTPNASKKFQPKMSAQAQKFEIFEKKLSLGVRSPCICTLMELKRSVCIHILSPKK